MTHGIYSTYSDTWINTFVSYTRQLIVTIFIEFTFTMTATVFIIWISLKTRQTITCTSTISFTTFSIQSARFSLAWCCFWFNWNGYLMQKKQSTKSIKINSWKCRKKTKKKKFKNKNGKKKKKKSAFKYSKAKFKWKWKKNWKKKLKQKKKQNLQNPIEKSKPKIILYYMHFVAICFHFLIYKYTSETTKILILQTKILIQKNYFHVIFCFYKADLFAVISYKPFDWNWNWNWYTDTPDV